MVSAWFLLSRYLCILWAIWMVDHANSTSSGWGCRLKCWQRIHWNDVRLSYYTKSYVIGNWISTKFTERWVNKSRQANSLHIYVSLLTQWPRFSYFTIFHVEPSAAFKHHVGPYGITAPSNNSRWRLYSQRGRSLRRINLLLYAAHWSYRPKYFRYTLIKFKILWNNHMWN